MAYELAGTLFPQRLPIGTEAIIRQADRATFKDFYDTWYRPDNMVLVMVGDFDPKLAVDLIADRFGDMSPRRGDDALPAENKGMFQCMFKLADIARPGVFPEKFFHVGR